ncbi:hypothetical protein VTJ49DRAFT_7570 [Mycothermus thermophilus]|uniref:WSC domain-containing protein n=1 Tax=Humicola insolens TaxID=85995 RepID=A0ABR3VGP5_HUMIN
MIMTVRRSNTRLLPLAALLLSTGSALPNPALNLARDAEEAPSYEPLGCFADNEYRVLPSKIISANDMTAAKCAEHCDGYEYFGTQYSSECHCGMIEPPVTADDSECNMPCSGDPNETCGGPMKLNVFYFDTACTEDQPAVPGFEYMGCFTDNVPQRVLTGHVVREGGMTLQKCAQACTAAGYPWFGVEYETECYCGTGLDEASTQVPDSECEMWCSGDQSQHCGSPDRLNVYRSTQEPSTLPSNPETAGDFAYVSCWTDKVDDRSLKAASYRSSGLTVEICAEQCKDYAYFGVEYGEECFCGDELGGEAAPAAECAMLCAGGANQWCGGPDRMNVYAKAPASSSSSTEPATETTTAETTPTEPATTEATTTPQTPASTEPAVTSPTTPDLTTITSCPPTPTYNGTPELCYQSNHMPSLCEALATSMVSAENIMWAIYNCRGVLSVDGFTIPPPASACFPTTALTASDNAQASYFASSLYDCLVAPAASVLCQSDNECQTKTTPNTALPSPTQPGTYDVLQGGGTFEDGTFGNWSIISSQMDIGTLEITSEETHSGDYGLVLEHTNGHFGSTGISTRVFVIPGKQYQLRMAFKQTTSTSSMGLVFRAAPATNWIDLPLHLQPANEWVDTSVNFTPTTSWVDVFMYFTASQSPPNTVYLDDIVLIQLD